MKWLELGGVYWVLPRPSNRHHKQKHKKQHQEILEFLDTVWSYELEWKGQLKWMV